MDMLPSGQADPSTIRRHVTMLENSPPQRLRLVAGRRGLTAAAAVLACGAAGLAAGPAAQAATAAPPAQLEGVSAVSASDAWAVGYTNNITTDIPSPLTLRWNGTSWATVASPSFAGGAELLGVSAVSASDAWAVGEDVNSAGDTETLTLHWNGTKWAQVASPDPGPTTSGFDELKAVSAVSASDVWAAGFYVDSSGAAVTLALHWNGTKWTAVHTPDPSGSTGLNVLSGVSTVSASDAWAVGTYYNSTSEDVPLTLHWNGTKWAQVSAPGVSGAEGTYLSGVDARTTSDMWATGTGTNTDGGSESLVLHSDGTKWTADTTSNPGGTDGDTLVYSVSADAASDAWAVGAYTPPSAVSATLAFHWNGTKWAQVTTPNPGGTSSTSMGDNVLKAVSAPAASDVWAVGYFSDATDTSNQTLVLHWNGTSWKRFTSPN
jgi:hypothetical protein